MSKNNKPDSPERTNLSRKQTYKKKKSKRLFKPLFLCFVLLIVSFFLFLNYEAVVNRFLHDDIQKSVPVIIEEDSDEENPEPVVDFPNSISQESEQTANPSYDLEVVEKTEEQESLLLHNEDGEIILFGEDDTVVHGVFGEKDYYFTLPPSTIGNDSYIELTMSTSELLNDRLSGITVLLNDKPVKSIRFNRLFEYRTIKVPLSKELLTDGVNKVSFHSQTFINNNICIDQDDPANWVIIHKTSYAFIDTGDSNITDDLLLNFPYPFVTTGGQEEIQTSIVIPENSSGSIIKMALELGQYLSSQTVKKEVVPIIFEDEWDQSIEKQHIIAIGPIGAWTREIADLITFKNISLQNGDLYLHNLIEKAQGDMRQILFVTAKDEASLIEKSQVLTTPEMTKQLTGNSIKINKMPVVEQEKHVQEMALPILDQALILADSRLVSQEFFLKVPSHWVINDKGILDLSFRASPLLKIWKNDDLKDQLGLTVYINQMPYTVPLPSMLEEDHPDDAYHYKISVPEDLIKSNSFLSVRFEFNYPYRQEGCRKKYKSGNWLTIEPDTKLTIPHDIKDSFSFSNWPAPFITKEGYGKVAFVVPEAVPENGLSQLSLLVNNLSSYYTLDDYIVKRGGLDQLEQKDLYHFIFLAGPKDHLVSNEKELLIPWTAEGGWNLSRYGFIEETAKYVSWMQHSFWNEEKAMIFFQSLEEDKQNPYLHEAFFDFLGEIDRSKESIIVVLNKANKAFTFDKKQIENSQETGGNTKYLTIYAVVFGSIFIIAIILYWIMIRRRKR